MVVLLEEMLSKDQETEGATGTNIAMSADLREETQVDYSRALSSCTSTSYLMVSPTDRLNPIEYFRMSEVRHEFTGQILISSQQGLSGGLLDCLHLDQCND